jgi:hypothetical protein
MWIITKHQCSDHLQEGQVIELITEMAQYTFASYADQFIQSFKSQLQDIPQTNAFAAVHLYKAKEVDMKTVEIWKTTITGEMKRKLITLEYVH